MPHTHGERRTCLCGCCPVRTGSIIITSIWLVLSLLNTLAYGSHLSKLLDVKGYDPDHLVERHPFGFRISLEDHVTMVFEYRKLLRSVYTNHRTAAAVLTCGYLAVEVIQGVMSGFCLYVTLKRGPSIRLFPWIAFNSFCLLVSTLTAVVVTFYLRFDLGGVYGMMIATAQLVLVYSTYFYLIRVVYSYMKELRDGEGDGQQTQPDATPFDGVTVVFANGRSGQTVTVNVPVPKQTQTEEGHGYENVQHQHQHATNCDRASVHAYQQQQNQHCNNRTGFGIGIPLPLPLPLALGMLRMN